MKCEIIRDLLPLYIDGLVSEKSKQEIEKHLETCKECQTYYQEMTGEFVNTVPVSEEDFKDANLIKGIKKKNRRRMIGILVGAVLVISMIAIFIFSQLYNQLHSQLKYNEIEFDYGTKGDKAYFTIKSKPGYELFFSGSVAGNDSTLKVHATQKFGKIEKDKMGWEAQIGTEDEPCKWTIEFQDKTIVIENGKLIEEIENKN